MPAGVKELQDLITRFISLSVGLAFLALTIMIMVSAFKFLTSGGDPKAVQSARNTLTYAVIGIVFMVGAWLGLRLIEAFTGVTVTNFCLGFPGAPTHCEQQLPPSTVQPPT
jgi:chromate transport protein ChrA